MNLATFDIRFPFPLARRIAKAIGVQRTNDDGTPHNGSESWADFLGLSGFNDNDVKALRRDVLDWFTLGAAGKWYRARGLGSPPD